MNITQALMSLFPALPAQRILEASPSAMPDGAYFVISEIADGARREYFPTPDGHQPQERSLTLLVTLYGKEGWKLADLRPTFERAKRYLPSLITEHPGMPPIRGVTRGAVMPPSHDDTIKRPFAGIRLHLTYLE